MTIAPSAPSLPSIVYPDCDGQPMSDNTVQFRWIVLLKENLECLFADNPDVFVAGDLLWYPVEEHAEIRLAPDVMVVLGRPKGDRGSYKQWEEGNIVPQVVIEILSPGNTKREMAKKLRFYERYGVEEYYVYDPDRNALTVWWRRGERLEAMNTRNWQSPRLGIRLLLTSETLEVYYPDGRPFLTTVELSAQAQQEAAKARQEATRADLEAARANLEAAKAQQETTRADREAAKAQQEAAKAQQETTRADREAARAQQEAAKAQQEAAKAERLAAQLRALGIEPDA
jgi:Uma2 family endonuclease